MAFSDPQTVIIDGNTLTLPRTGNGPSSGVFTTADQSTKLTVSHARNKRVRSTIRLDNQKIAPDPLYPASNVPYSGSVYLVMDMPLTGYSIAEQNAVISGLLDYLNANSGAAISKFIGGES